MSLMSVLIGDSGFSDLSLHSTFATSQIMYPLKITTAHLRGSENGEGRLTP